MPHEIDTFARQLILQKARQLAQQRPPVAVDEQDIQSELTLHLLRRRELYDANRGTWTTFVQVVINNHARDLLSKWKCEHTHLPTINLSEHVNCVYADAGAQSTTRSHEECVELHFDVTTVLETLPDKDRQLCEELSQTTTQQAAQNIGCSRSHAYNRKAAIRKIFEASGLHEYHEFFPKPEDTSDAASVGS